MLCFLSYLPASDSEKEAEDVGLFLLLQLFHVFEGTHLDVLDERSLANAIL